MSRNRQQPPDVAGQVRKTARADDDALTLPQITVYRKAVETFRHMASIAAELARSEQSHECAELAQHCERIGLQAALAIERIQRIAGDAPPSSYWHVNREQLALYHEATIALHPGIELRPIREGQ